MNELTIVQHNTLIESGYQLARDEMRLLNLALTKVDSRKANIGKIEIYPDEFSKMYNLNKRNIWRHMKKSLNTIMTKPVHIKFLDGKGKLKEKSIAWLSSKEYYTKQCDGTKIELNFTDDIAAYLFELNGNFTKVNFEYVRRLTTSFSYRLYQWLIQKYKMKNGGYYDLTIPLETIKKRAGFADTAYPQWRDFKSRVIKPAVEEINQKTDLSVNFNVITRGNKAYALRFIYINELQKNTAILVSGGTCVLPAEKPIRPRLLRRPKVEAGSHLEGEWQRANLKLLSEYLKNLKVWDPTAKLTMSDLKKIVSYSRIFDPTLHEKVQQELLDRQNKT